MVQHLRYGSRCYIHYQLYYVIDFIARMVGFYDIGVVKVPGQHSKHGCVVVQNS